MSGDAVAHHDEIDELDDGRCPDAPTEELGTAILSHPQYADFDPIRDEPAFGELIRG